MKDKPEKELPLSNTCLDTLVHTLLPDSVQHSPHKRSATTSKISMKNGVVKHLKVLVSTPILQLMRFVLLIVLTGKKLIQLRKLFALPPLMYLIWHWRICRFW